eukprot:jgi/Picre1/33294/NNA_008618.t1
MGNCVSMAPQGIPECQRCGKRGDTEWHLMESRDKKVLWKDKALGKQAEATLEMIWSKTEWLTEEHIQGMWDNHRVRRDVVIDWFMKKRRTSRKQQGGP